MNRLCEWEVRAVWGDAVREEYDKTLERKRTEEVTTMEELGGGSICVCLKERENYWSAWSRSVQSVTCRWQLGSTSARQGYVRRLKGKKLEEEVKDETHSLSRTPAGMWKSTRFTEVCGRIDGEICDEDAFSLGWEAACCCFRQAVARGYSRRWGEGGGWRRQGWRGVTTEMRWEERAAFCCWCFWWSNLCSDLRTKGSV